MEVGSFKDLESVSLKATYDMRIGNRLIVPGEVITFFDTIQMAGLNEIKSRVSANGGYGNPALVYWETTKEVQLNFSRGVFSKAQFALMSNANLIEKDSNSLKIHNRELLESDENSQVICKFVPLENIHIYSQTTGEQLNYTQEDEILTIEAPYESVIVDYDFLYTSPESCVHIGSRLFNGFVELEGRTRVKDDTTGQVVTGIIKIPKLKLMSDLSIRLGASANPILANFNAIGVPVGSRDSSYVSEFHFLSSDIESDI